MVKDDVFTSLHINEVETEVRDTKRGAEELTAEIPNVSEEATKDLNENGIIRIGAKVKEGDHLIGKVTPKGETLHVPPIRELRPDPPLRRDTSPRSRRIPSRRPDG